MTAACGSARGREHGGGGRDAPGEGRAARHRAAPARSVALVLGLFAALPQDSAAQARGGDDAPAAPVRADSATTRTTTPTTVPYLVVGDAIPEPLTAAPGDAQRGRAIVANRRVGQCLLCHTGPFPDPHLQGSLAPSLAGAGARWSAGQLRLRIADAPRLNPATTMPAYHRSSGFEQVAAAWRGRPALEAQQVEDVVAFLLELRD